LLDGAEGMLDGGIAVLSSFQVWRARSLTEPRSAAVPRGLSARPEQSGEV
jgi:hypothetical protein